MNASSAQGSDWICGLKLVRGIPGPETHLFVCDRHVVTHRRTKPTLRSLTRGERTGSGEFCLLGPYVLGLCEHIQYKPYARVLPQLFFPVAHIVTNMVSDSFRLVFLCCRMIETICNDWILPRILMQSSQIAIASPQSTAEIKCACVSAY